jgi:hypothetical protein
MAEKNKELKEALAKNVELEEALAEEKSSHEKTVEESLATIEELSKKVGTEKTKRRTSVKHNGVKYMVAIERFILDKVTYTAKDLKTNEELVAKLVKMKSAVLVEE